MQRKHTHATKALRFSNLLKQGGFVEAHSIPLTAPCEVQKGFAICSYILQL